MFNGSGIVRTLGRSTLMQIIIFPDVYDAVQTGASDDASCGIHTLQTALRSGDRAGSAMIRSSEFAFVNIGTVTCELTGVFSRVSRKSLSTTSETLGP